MPYKVDYDNIKVGEFNRNRKLTKDQKKEIYYLYHNTETSQRKLARQFGVSRRLITFIVDPEKEKKNKELFAERQKTGKYYDREKHNKSVREHRRYKKKLYDEGKI